MLTEAPYRKPGYPCHTHIRCSENPLAPKNSVPFTRGAAQGAAARLKGVLLKDPSLATCCVLLAPPW